MLNRAIVGDLQRLRDELDPEPDPLADFGEIDAAIMDDGVRIVAAHAEADASFDRELGGDPFAGVGEVAEGQRARAGAPIANVGAAREGVRAAEPSEERPPLPPRKDRDPRTFDDWRRLQEDAGVTIVGGGGGGGGGKSKKPKPMTFGGGGGAFSSAPSNGENVDRDIRQHVRGLTAGERAFYAPRPIDVPLNVLRGVAELIAQGKIPAEPETERDEDARAGDLYLWWPDDEEGKSRFYLRLLRNYRGATRTALAEFARRCTCGGKRGEHLYGCGGEQVRREDDRHREAVEKRRATIAARKDEALGG